MGCTVLVLGSANERQRYIVTLSLIGWVCTQNNPWMHCARFHVVVWKGILQSPDGQVSYWVWLSQWETTWQSNVVSHWLKPYLEWSLMGQSRNKDKHMDWEKGVKWIWLSPYTILNRINTTSTYLIESNPDSKVRGANMGPIWGGQDPGGPHVGPMNFAIWGGFSFYLIRTKETCTWCISW